MAIYKKEALSQGFKLRRAITPEYTRLATAWVHELTDYISSSPKSSREWIGNVTDTVVPTPSSLWMSI
ncbi:hypothetical protein D3C77_757330 [compost metagenome]